MMGESWIRVGACVGMIVYFGLGEVFFGDVELSWGAEGAGVEDPVGV